MVKLKETKVLLTVEEDQHLEQLSAKEGRSKTNFCTNEIRKLIKKNLNKLTKS